MLKVIEDKSGCPPFPFAVCDMDFPFGDSIARFKERADAELFVWAKGIEAMVPAQHRTPKDDVKPDLENGDINGTRVVWVPNLIADSSVPIYRDKWGPRITGRVTVSAELYEKIRNASDGELMTIDGDLFKIVGGRLELVDDDVQPDVVIGE